MSRKLTLLAVFAVFFIPLLVAVALHSEWLDWRIPATRQHGELIEPVQPLGSFSAVTADGQTISEAVIADRWQLAYVAPRQCTEQCLERLYWLRQVRRAQDRHRPEIGLMLVTGDELDAAAPARIVGLADDFVMLTGTAGAEMAGRFPDPDRGSFYIVDPNGNIIERFDGDADPNGIRRDLRRLLTWTRQK